MRLIFFSLILFTLCAGSIAAQQSSKASDVSITLPPELDRVLRDYEANWKAGDAAALSRLFTEDGFVLPDGQLPVKGREAIQKLYTGKAAPLSLRAFSYATNGNVGYIIGGYTGQSGMPDFGKFTLTLHKSAGGRWLIASDMDNSNHRRRE
jgi:ketosteroid isomerase-like protein